jgi:hypothetical protein
MLLLDFGHAEVIFSIIEQAIFFIYIVISCIHGRANGVYQQFQFIQAFAEGCFSVALNL